MRADRYRKGQVPSSGGFLAFTSRSVVTGGVCPKGEAIARKSFERLQLLMLIRVSGALVLFYLSTRLG